MSYHREIYLRDINKTNKYSHLKSKSHKEFEKRKHIILSLKNVDIKYLDEFLFLYIKGHNKKFNHYFLIGEFKLVFNKIQDFKNILTGMIDNRTFISWSNYLRDADNNLKRRISFRFYS